MIKKIWLGQRDLSNIFVAVLFKNTDAKKKQNKSVYIMYSRLLPVPNKNFDDKL